MMTRKQQKIEREKAALRQRVEDIAIGAFNGVEVDAYLREGFADFADLISDWMLALAEAFPDAKDSISIVWLKKFVDLHTATDYLYECGARA